MLNRVDDLLFFSFYFPYFYLSYLNFDKLLYKLFAFIAKFREFEVSTLQASLGFILIKVITLL